VNNPFSPPHVSSPPRGAKLDLSRYARLAADRPHDPKGDSMRKFLLAGAVLAISACSGGGNNDANNASATDNMSVDQNMTMDANAMIGTDANGAAVNGAVDANTANLMQQDANTHDHDTNLANGI
jgi:hypothetical protein